MDKEAISRRDFLKIAGVSMGTLALSSYGAIAQQIPEMERPNTIFIISDDHAFHAMSCYSSGMNKTPNLQDGLKGISEVHTSKELDEAITYFQNNHSRMDYPTYEKKGYHITSSTTESACRHVVGDRLKRSGMRWITEGAQYTTMLRLKWKNGKWTDFWMRYRPDLAA